MKTTLLGRVLKGGSWSLLGNFASQGLRFGSNLLLTRLLFPEAFGLMAIAQSILLAARLLSDVGLMQSVIRSERGHQQEFLNTIWTLDIVKGLGILVLMALIAPLVARGYSQPMLVALVPAMGIAALISSFASTKIALVNRKLEIGRLTLMELGSQFIGILVMVVWAWIYPTPWALVGGNWANTLTMTLSSHFLLKGTNNKFHWDKAAVREVMSFGGWVMVSSSVTFLLGEGSNLLNASLVGAKAVGFLGLSTNLALVVWNAIQQVGGRVLFPAYSEVFRDRPHELPRVVERSRRIQLLGGCAVAAVFALGGDRIIDFFYDKRYHAVGALLQIQAVGTAFAFISSSYTGVLWAIGRPGLNTIMLGAQTTILFALLVAGNHFGGLLGLMTASSFLGILLYPINTIMYSRLKMFQPRTDIWPALLGVLLALYVYNFGLWRNVSF